MYLHYFTNIHLFKKQKTQIMSCNYRLFIRILIFITSILFERTLNYDNYQVLY